MKEQEAIKILETDNCWECRRGSDSAANCEYGGCSVSVATKTAIQALEEIQQYRAIGTVQQCKEVMTKQTPTKPYCVVEDEVLCPYCHAVLDYENICECGQRIDWS